MIRKPLFVLALLSLLTPAAVRAQFEPPVPPVEEAVSRMAGSERIVPRSFRFTDLKPKANEEHLPLILRPEHGWTAAESELEYLKANPPYLPVSSFAQFTLDQTPSPAMAKGSFSPLAPTIGVGFEGITQSGYIPGEPTIAAGPLNILTAGNVSVTVTNKDGSTRVETSGATFFGVPAAEGAISDAQCYYDALRGRFVALCFTVGTSPSNFSNFYLAVSKTNDARGAWWLYKFDMTKDGTTQTANWADYQGLGISDDKIVFSAQQFSFATNSYQYPKFRVIDRAAAYSGGTLSYVDFANFAVPAGGDASDNFVTKPARNLTSGDNTIYCLCVRTGSGSRVTYRTITGTPASPVLSSGNLVAVSSYSAPPDAPNLGSTTLVATNDCRPTDFYVRNGVLIATWHTAASISATNVSAIRLFRMRTSDRAVLTDETFGQANTFYYYPAVTVDSVGTVFLGFGRSSSTEYASAYVSGKRRSDTAIQSAALLKAGTAGLSSGVTRWGDYTGIDQDASLFRPNTTSAWYVGQWTKTASAFGTWAGKLTFTYGEVFGSVLNDCDGSAATTTDRAPAAGVTVALKQGATTVASTTTNVSGQYSFGYLESGTYDIVVTPPVSGTNVDATAGTGGTSQTRSSASTVQVVMTNAQASSGNNFVVAASKSAPVASSISPTVRSVGDPQFTLTVNGSGFSQCSIVRVDGFDRTTTYLSATQLTAIIPTTDQGGGGTKTITVFTPTPGGGTSSGLTLTINGTPDTTPPSVTLTAPVGGENWGAGTTHNITWTATDNVVVSSVDLAWSSDGGATFPNTIASGIANSGSYSWAVPVQLTSTARVRVRAVDGSGNLGSDSSATNFAITGWNVTASAGANGSISPSGVIGVADGATPAFTITPATGYHVADVLVNGVSVGAVTSYTFAPVHADQTIAASFAINTYTLTVNVTGSGTVARSPSQATYDHGTVVQLTATPALDWNFDFWSGDASGATNPLSVTMDGNKTIGATFSQRTYVWSAVGSGAFGTATNWTPNRVTTASNDVLLFNNGGTFSVTAVPTQTVGQVRVTNSTRVTFTATTAATLGLAGGTGHDLVVEAGSSITLSGATAVTMAIGAGASGDISGTFAVTGGAHRLTAVDNNSLGFNSGSLFQAGVTLSGNPFGTTGLNTVVFRSGSLYQHVAGSNPFGASAPNSVVTFQSGSRYRVDGPITPAMSGRNYADFEYNNGAAITSTGSSACTMDSLVVSQGTFNLNLAGGGTIRGGVHVKTGATLGLNPTGSPTFHLAGTSAQDLDIQGTLTHTTPSTLNINNPSGVTLTSNFTWNQILNFTSGRIVTGARALLLGTTATVSGADATTGWVNGNLTRLFAAGAFSGALPVGDATRYAPVSVSGSGAGAGFGLTATTTAGDHPSLTGSGISDTRSLNRWWTLTSTNGSGASWDATFAFPAGDLDAGADPASFIGRAWNGSAWSALAMGTLNALDVTTTGLSTATAGTQFAFGNLPSFTITASAGANGSISPSGAVAVTSGSNQSFTITPNSGFGVSSVLVDGSSVGAVTTYTFNNVTANHTIAASFADTQAPSVTVTSPDGGESQTIGDFVNLTWTATDNVGVFGVDLELSRNGTAGPFESIATGVANSGSLSWQVTGPATTNARLRVTARDAAANSAQDLSNAAFSIVANVGVLDGPVTEFALSPVLPNPVRGSTRFQFALPRSAPVHLGLLDVQGRELLVVADGVYPAGRHMVEWAAPGTRLDPGLYFLRMTTPERTVVRRFVLMK